MPWSFCGMESEAVGGGNLLPAGRFLLGAGRFKEFVVGGPPLLAGKMAVVDMMIHLRDEQHYVKSCRSILIENFQGHQRQQVEMDLPHLGQLKARQKLLDSHGPNS